MGREVPLEEVEELLVGLDHEEPRLDGLILQESVHCREEFPHQPGVGKNRL